MNIYDRYDISIRFFAARLSGEMHKEGIYLRLDRYFIIDLTYASNYNFHETFVKSKMRLSDVRVFNIQHEY